jgi:hypothetical protein
LLVIVPVAVRVGCGAEHEAKFCAAGFTVADRAMSLFAVLHSSWYVALSDVSLPGLSNSLSCAHPPPAVLVVTAPPFTCRCPAAVKFSVCTGPCFPDEYSHW